jgi:murein DD-endopeptidase MepM/ murein hydrolase activator NlpD
MINPLKRAGRIFALALAVSALTFATSQPEPIHVPARSAASARVDPAVALASSLGDLGLGLRGAERTFNRIDREAWALRAASGDTWMRIGQAEDELRKRVEQTLPSPRLVGASTSNVGTRIDEAFRRLSLTLGTITDRVEGMHARLASARRRLEYLESSVDRHIRMALRLLSEIRAEGFRDGSGSTSAELLVAGRHVLSRLVVLKRDLAGLRANLFGLADGLGRQERGAGDRLASARARKASEFGLPFDRLPGPGEWAWGIFLVCPVDPPRTVYNDFGATRAGGGYHAHQGNDIAAPLGTPVRAPFSGTAEASPNGPGGLAVKVFGPAGFVYNAHLSAYGTLGPVEAGTVIGYVGNSGNASGAMPHNHFEWHPGGGGAVDPHPLLMQVC